MMPSVPLERILTFTSREELRNWLQEHGTTESCCWVPVSLKPLPNTLLYLDAVEEALCFGWIDGVKRKLPMACYYNAYLHVVAKAHGQSSIRSVCAD